MLLPLRGLYRRLLGAWLVIQSLVVRVFSWVVFLVRWAWLASRRYRQSAASQALSAATLT